MAVGDFLYENNHLAEVDVSFAENVGQRLDIAKFFQDYWRYLKREREMRGREEKKSSMPGILLIWNNMSCLMD